VILDVDMAKEISPRAVRGDSMGDLGNSSNSADNNDHKLVNKLISDNISAEKAIASVHQALNSAK
jgi:hypothetical protein